MRPKGTAEELQRRRFRAIALLKDGYGVCETAKILGATPGAVTQWHQAYRASGQDALKAKPHLGRPPKLSAKQLQKLRLLLLAGPSKNGYPTELWTLKRIAEVIRRQFGVCYDPSGVWHILRAMGWSCQKPERRAKERDEQAIARWRQKDWPRIKKSPQNRSQRHFH